MNVCGGMDSLNMYRGPQIPNVDSNNSNLNSLQINGGHIYVNAAGDGLDANGNIYVNGGTTVVNGPTNSGNGSLDYDREFKITSGIFIASGSSGMAQNASEISTQNTLMINFEETIKTGEVISIFDELGNEVITYSAKKDYNNIVISTKELKNAKKYSIYTSGESDCGNINGIYEIGGYTNGELYTEVTLENIITNIGKYGIQNNMMPNMDNNMVKPGKNNPRGMK